MPYGGGIPVATIRPTRRSMYAGSAQRGYEGGARRIVARVPSDSTASKWSSTFGVGFEELDWRRRTEEMPVRNRAQRRAFQERQAQRRPRGDVALERGEIGKRAGDGEHAGAAGLENPHQRAARALAPRLEVTVAVNHQRARGRAPAPRAG